MTTPGPARPLRLATRGSALARAQTALAATALRRAGAVAVEEVIVRTVGDRQAATPLESLPGQGWFTADLERALLDDAADIAVHSAKDLAIDRPPELRVAAVLARGDARDAVVTRDGAPLRELPVGARLGTSSARRVALLGVLHPTLRPVPIRGNVDTRLRKLDAGEVDALVLAAAGLDRLGLADRVAERLDPTQFVPSPAQGAIALEVRRATAVEALVEGVNEAETFAVVSAERAVLAALGGGCLLPLGAWGRLESGRLVVVGALGCEGGAVRYAEVDGDAGDPAGAGARLAALLR